MSQRSDPSGPFVPIIFLLGCPASGKGTHGPMIARKLDMTHLSVGELLRDLVQRSPAPNESTSGGMPLVKLRDYVANRQLVPPSFIVSILKIEIDNRTCNHSETGGFVIDGFPRDRKSAELWEKLDSRYRPKAIFQFDCDKEVALQRFVNRGRDGGDIASQTRIFKARFEEYENNWKQIFNFYQQMDGALKYRIDTNARTENVEPKIEEVLERYKKDIEASKSQSPRGESDAGDANDDDEKSSKSPGEGNDGRIEEETEEEVEEGEEAEGKQHE